MYDSESATYCFAITFGTESGELPSKQELEELVKQKLHFGGELEPITGLSAFAVRLEGMLYG